MLYEMVYKWISCRSIDKSYVMSCIALHRQNSAFHFNIILQRNPVLCGLYQVIQFIPVILYDRTLKEMFQNYFSKNSEIIKILNKYILYFCAETFKLFPFDLQFPFE